LTLSANPLHGHRLALDREARAIQSELDRSRHRDHFELQTLWAVEALDLLAGLRRYSPSVVHFSGHGIPPMTVAPIDRPARRDFELSVRGNRSGHGIPPMAVAPIDRPARRDIEPSVRSNRSVGLCFQHPDGSVEVVSPAALRGTFRAVGSSVKLVVLNACYNELQAKALCAHVDCVIGTRGTIRDDAAIHFAIGLYGGIAGGATILSAFEQGVAAIHLKGLADRPRLLVRRGVDPGALILAPGDRGRRRA
jgi:hypothetical protein